ncbi:helix-turn-helix domain-containing protein [Streptomyces virginiae]|uniref:helix-turn-helix domain-containing protein n=1 Tax=Streptomyces virginiae TaxID=1961 RepID=UPI0036C05AF9
MTNGGAWRGRPKAEERQKFLELVRQGMSNEVASRIVGINPRTGREWRNGRSERSKGPSKPGKRTRPAIQPITGEGRRFAPHPLHGEQTDPKP